jgi:hypothetical protein
LSIAPPISHPYGSNINLQGEIRTDAQFSSTGDILFPVTSILDHQAFDQKHILGGRSERMSNWASAAVDETG